MSVIQEQLRLPNPSGILELFELDTTVFGDSEPRRFHAGTTFSGGNIVWQGLTYFRYPIVITGFETSGDGRLPRPTMKCANVTQAISVLCRDFDDMVGCEVIRHRTHVKYLDAVNFPSGENPNADPTAAYADDIFFINRKISESKLFVDFELCAAMEVGDVKLPRRQVIANSCTVEYRGPECGYAGGPVANSMDVATSDPALDKCGKRISSCKLRFGATAELPFGGVPGAGLYR